MKVRFYTRIRRTQPAEYDISSETAAEIGCRFFREFESLPQIRTARTVGFRHLHRPVLPAASKKRPEISRKNIRFSVSVDRKRPKTVVPDGKKSGTGRRCDRISRKSGNGFPIRYRESRAQSDEK